MELAITIFAWIGFCVVVTLSVPTAFIWSAWACEQTLEYRTRLLGMFYATTFYCMIALKPETQYRKAAGRLLYLRYRNFREKEPEITAEFEQCLAEGE